MFKERSSNKVEKNLKKYIFGSRPKYMLLAMLMHTTIDPDSLGMCLGQGCELGRFLLSSLSSSSSSACFTSSSSTFLFLRVQVRVRVL